MKKIFVYGIAASMLFLGVVSSCSKKDDSSSSSSSTSSTSSSSSTTSVNPTPGANSITYDGKSVTFLITSCNLDNGSSNLYTMYSSDGDVTFSTLKFYGTPTAKTYTVGLTLPTNADGIQLNIKIGNYTYTAKSGSATVEIVSGKVVAKWADLTFVKSGVPDKIISGDIRCD